MWDEDMIRKSLMVFLVFLAVLLMAIGCGSIVASLKGEPLLTRYVNPPFLSAKGWLMGVAFNPEAFWVGFFQTQDRPGINRHGTYVSISSPRLMIYWSEIDEDSQLLRIYAGEISPAAAFVLAAILGLYPIGYFLAPRLRRRSHRRRHGLCVQCGFDLSGNESGVCPECGTRT
jgi:hypothetical protein